MEFIIDRRAVLATGAALAVSHMLPVRAQDKPTLRFAAVFSDKDIRADMIRMVSKDVEADVKIEPFYGGTLFKQGTELVALQRDNLEMGNVAPQDISKQVAAWSVLTSAYTFRDANHVLSFFASDVGAQMKKQAEDQLKIKILGPTFFGTRQVGLKPKKKVSTPADLAGVKLRMPPGDAWQLLGRSLGANPTPMAFAETYTGLQTGAIDGQDNPLPNVQNMKFYEVMSQIVLTSHLVAFDVLCMSLKSWNAHGTGQAEDVSGRSRQGACLEHEGAPEARSGTGGGIQEAGARGVHAGRQRLPCVCAEGVPGVGRGEVLGAGDPRQDRCGQVVRQAESRGRPARPATASRVGPGSRLPCEVAGDIDYPPAPGRRRSMRSLIRTAAGWMRRRAESVVAALLGDHVRRVPRSRSSSAISSTSRSAGPPSCR